MLPITTCYRVERSVHLRDGYSSGLAEVDYAFVAGESSYGVSREFHEQDCSLPEYRPWPDIVAVGHPVGCLKQQRRQRDDPNQLNEQPDRIQPIHWNETCSRALHG